MRLLALQLCLALAAQLSAPGIHHLTVPFDSFPAQQFLSALWQQKSVAGPASGPRHTVLSSRFSAVGTLKLRRVSSGSWDKQCLCLSMFKIHLEWSLGFFGALSTEPLALLLSQRKDGCRLPSVPLCGSMQKEKAGLFMLSGGRLPVEESSIAHPDSCVFDPTLV